MDKPSPSAHLTSIHGGHVALLLGLVFLILYAVQPLVDPTPENEPNQERTKSYGEPTQTSPIESTPTTGLQERE